MSKSAQTLAADAEAAGFRVTVHNRPTTTIVHIEDSKTRNGVVTFSGGKFVHSNARTVKGYVHPRSVADLRRALSI